MCPNGGTIKDLAKAVAGTSSASGAGGASTGTPQSGNKLLAAVLPRIRKKQAAPVLDDAMTPTGV